MLIYGIYFELQEKHKKYNGIIAPLMFLWLLTMPLF